MHPSTHQTAYSRRYLPHLDLPDQHVVITYHLDDSLPPRALASLAVEAPTDACRRRRIERLLDSGHGSCVLHRDDCASIIVDAWRWFDRARYDLEAWVVMPNHVHVLIRQRVGWPLPVIIGAWKSFTAKAINARLGKSGRLWHREFWDRTIRDDRHFADVVRYIHANPVKAGLVAEATDWKWSSARDR